MSGPTAPYKPRMTAGSARCRSARSVAVRVAVATSADPTNRRWKGAFLPLARPRGLSFHPTPRSKPTPKTTQSTKRLTSGAMAGSTVSSPRQLYRHLVVCLPWPGREANTTEDATQGSDGDPASAGGRLVLQSLQKLIVFGVRADPEPSDLIPLPKSNGPITHSNANRVDRFTAAHTLELQARVVWIRTPGCIDSACLLLNLQWEPIKPFSKSSGDARLYGFVTMFGNTWSRGIVSPESISC